MTPDFLSCTSTLWRPMVPSHVRTSHLDKTLAHCALATAGDAIRARLVDLVGSPENVTVYVEEHHTFKMEDAQLPENKITMAQLCDGRYPWPESSAPQYPPVNALVESLSVKRRILKSFAVHDHANIVLDGWADRLVYSRTVPRNIFGERLRANWETSSKTTS